MSTSEAPLRLWRDIVTGLFPWLAWFRVATDKGLSVKTEGGRLHLEGDAGDPAAARVDDVAGYEYVQIVAGAVVAVYRSRASGAASVWSPVASGALPPVDGVTAGTPITITTGSDKVTIA